MRLRRGMLGPWGAAGRGRGQGRSSPPSPWARWPRCRAAARRRRPGHPGLPRPTPPRPARRVRRGQQRPRPGRRRASPSAGTTRCCRAEARTRTPRRPGLAATRRRSPPTRASEPGWRPGSRARAFRLGRPADPFSARHRHRGRLPGGIGNLEAGAGQPRLPDGGQPGPGRDPRPVKAGRTRIRLSAGRLPVVAFESGERLYWGFRGTQGLTVTGSIQREHGRYTGTLSYVIRDSYGFPQRRHAGRLRPAHAVLADRVRGAAAPRRGPLVPRHHHGHRGVPVTDSGREGPQAGYWSCRAQTSSQSSSVMVRPEERISASSVKYFSQARARARTG